MFSDSSFRSEIKSHLARNACEMSVYEEKEQDVPDDAQRVTSPGFSSVSMKSNNSMLQPPYLSDVDAQRAASPGFSSVSMKSNNSMFQPPYLSDVDAQRAASPGFSCVSMKSNNSMFQSPGLSDSPAVSSDPA